ncbi:D-arabinono-1,4-lactone oxidase [Nesterenkonia sp.]|uniref:D-arabinono-1,4-lactone oxidase n=1 Tax=Nesterenkonia sp. TaxID=704201 RepID=UPI002635470D|nr:D-arabinono-1,4-lactone oxidase [Nesterenkonia sp.]
MTEVGFNWARNLQYSAGRLLQPRSVEELQGEVAASPRLRAVGSRHSFNTIADTDGDLVSLAGLPRVFELDESARTVTIDAGTRYGELAEALQARGFALQNMASLPHITVVGSVATGTHGSGDRNPPLSHAVREVEIVLADGSLRTFVRGEEDFAGAVVNLGALGVVTRVTLDVVPSFELRQDVYDGISWDGVLESFEQLTSAAYSVSLFTRWTGETFGHAWLKTARADGAEAPAELLGRPALDYNIGLAEGPAEAATEQTGVWGSWDARLPHFRMNFTPSNGTELQSEYLLPREHAVEAMRRLRALGDRIQPHLMVSEIRTMAADDQWLSPAYGRQTVGFHFTWRQHTEEVTALLPVLEEQLGDLQARPHWGKLFSATNLAALYPRFDDFRSLAERLDPEGVFHNDFLRRTLLRERPVS